MKIGAIVSGLIAGVAACGVIVAFLNNSSPYVTVAQARTTQGDSLHLAGDIQKETVVNDFRNKTLRFSIKDEEGATVPVVYHGPPPANMGDATKVVAIGKMEGDAFVAHRMLVKCPSKYEGDKGLVPEKTATTPGQTLYGASAK